MLALGLTALGGTIAGASAIGNAGKKELSEQRSENKNNETVDRVKKVQNGKISKRENAVNEAKKIMSKYKDDLTLIEEGSDDYNYLQQQILTLTQLMPDLAAGVDNVSTSLSRWAGIVHEADGAIKSLKTQSAE